MKVLFNQQRRFILTKFRIKIHILAWVLYSCFCVWMYYIRQKCLLSCFFLVEISSVSVMWKNASQKVSGRESSQGDIKGLGIRALCLFLPWGFLISSIDGRPIESIRWWRDTYSKKISHLARLNFNDASRCIQCYSKKSFFIFIQFNCHRYLKVVL